MRPFMTRSIASTLGAIAVTTVGIASASAADVPVAPAQRYSAPVEQEYVAPPPPVVYRYAAPPPVAYYAPPPAVIVPGPYRVYRPYYGRRFVPYRHAFVRRHHWR
jgi:hypothetical protein